VDKAGNTIDFLFREKRDKAAAWRFFEKAMAQNGWPETVTIDNRGPIWLHFMRSMPSVDAHQGSSGQVFEQHRRTGQSGDQTHHSANAGVQTL
jgi:transposase-like protein